MKQVVTRGDSSFWWSLLKLYMTPQRSSVVYSVPFWICAVVEFFKQVHSRVCSQKYCNLVPPRVWPLADGPGNEVARWSCGTGNHCVAFRRPGYQWSIWRTDCSGSTRCLPFVWFRAHLYDKLQVLSQPAGEMQVFLSTGGLFEPFLFCERKEVLHVETFYASILQHHSEVGCSRISCFQVVIVMLKKPIWFTFR